MAKRTVRLEIMATGTYDVEVDEDDLRPMLKPDGRDFTDEVVEEATDCSLSQLGLGICAPVDQAIDGADLLESLNVSVTGIELVTPEKGPTG